MKLEKFIDAQGGRLGALRQVSALRQVKPPA